ncbi:hypothetical protein ACWFPY_24625 [Nocardia fluminea]
MSIDDSAGVLRHGQPASGAHLVNPRSTETVASGGVADAVRGDVVVPEWMRLEADSGCPSAPDGGFGSRYPDGSLHSVSIGGPRLDRRRPELELDSTLNLSMCATLPSIAQVTRRGGRLK